MIDIGKMPDIFLIDKIYFQKMNLLGNFTFSKDRNESILKHIEYFSNIN